MILRYDLLSDKCLFNTPICNSNNFLQVYSISCSSMGRTEITEVLVHNCMIYHHFPLLLKDLKIWKIYASTLLHPVAHSLKYRISQHSCFFFFSFINQYSYFSTSFYSWVYDIVSCIHIFFPVNFKYSFLQFWKISPFDRNLWLDLSCLPTPNTIRSGLLVPWCQFPDQWLVQLHPSSRNDLL